MRSLAELLALTGLAITQPVLDVFGKAPDVFLFRDSDRADIIAFAVVVAVVPTLVLFTVEVLAGLVAPPARAAAHLAFIAGLSGLLALQLAKHFGLTAWAAALVIALALAALAVVAYRRWPATRLLLLYLGVAPVLFVAVFLTASPTSDLLAAQDVEAADVAPARNARSVVFLQLDEWPLEAIVNGDGAVDPELYPNLAAIAEDGTWYRNTTTVANLTSHAVPAILTGRYPEGERAAVASDYPENLFTLLANEFDLDVIESAAKLCPPNLCDEELVDDPEPVEEVAAAADTTPLPAPPRDGLGALLDDAAGVYEDLVSPDPDADGSADALRQETSVVTATTTTTSTTRPSQGPSAEDAAEAAAAEESGFNIAGLGGIPVLQLDAVDQLTGSIEAGEDPTLHYLHLLLPHSPYQFLPSGQSYDPGVSIAGGSALEAITGTRSDHQAAVDVDRQRLVLQGMYVDRVIGDVLERLRATGLDEDTIVVVVADHGVALQPGTAPRPTSDEGLNEDTYPDVLPVPLLISGPGIEAGVVSDDNVQTIDVMPTLADLLGVDIPWPVDGLPVTSEQRPDDQKRFHVVSFVGGIAGTPGVGPATDYDGGPVLAEALARNVDTLLRSDNPEYRLYDLDAAGELVGARVDDVPSGPDSDLSVLLEEPDALADVDPASGVLRTHVVGRVEGGPDDEPVTVALALNGRVAAVVTTWPEEDEPHRFETMVVPDFLRAGANRLTAYRVIGPEGERTLSPIPVS